MEYRLRAAGDSDDKQRMMAHRDRYHKSISATLQNVVMNDYHRGLVDLFLLFHTGEVTRALAKASKAVSTGPGSAAPMETTFARPSQRSSPTCSAERR